MKHTNKQDGDIEKFLSSIDLFLFVHHTLSRIFRPNSSLLFLSS